MTSWDGSFADEWGGGCFGALSRETRAPVPRFHMHFRTVPDLTCQEDRRLRRARQSGSSTSRSLGPCNEPFGRARRPRAEDRDARLRRCRARRSMSTCGCPTARLAVEFGSRPPRPGCRTRDAQPSAEQQHTAPIIESANDVRRHVQRPCGADGAMEAYRRAAPSARGASAEPS